MIPLCLLPFTLSCQAKSQTCQLILQEHFVVVGVMGVVILVGVSVSCSGDFAALGVVVVLMIVVVGVMSMALTSRVSKKRKKKNNIKKKG